MLLHGRQNDLANATIRSCTVLHGDRWSTEWWSLERWQDRPVVVTGPDGGQIEVRQARLDPEGALVLVHPKGKLVRTSGRCGSDPHGLRPPREMRMVVAPGKARLSLVQVSPWFRLMRGPSRYHEVCSAKTSISVVDSVGPAGHRS